MIWKVTMHIAHTFNSPCRVLYTDMSSVQLECFTCPKFIHQKASIVTNYLHLTGTILLRQNLYEKYNLYMKKIWFIYLKTLAMYIMACIVLFFFKKNI